MYQVQMQKGITLIALVITIIVLIILAGVAINLSIGENGLVTRAKNAQKLSDEAAVKEKIETAVLKVQIEEISNAGTLTLQKLNESLEAKDSNISLKEYKEEDKILKGIYTLDGKAYEFTIDENFKVIVEEAQQKPLCFGEITWASNKASITLTSKISDSIEYQVNGTTDGSWIQGKQVTNLNNGDIVYARINDGTTITETQNLEIKDKIKPEEFEVTTSDLTYNSVKLTTTGTTDNQTGLATYSYIAATSSSEIVKEITGQTVTEYTIDGLEAETEYVVYMLAYDNAGNVRKSNEETVTTAKMQEKLSDIINGTDYGKKINYCVTVKNSSNEDVTLDDWKVFYNDGNNVYIILSNYLDNSLIPEEIGMITSETYNVCWSASSLNEPYNDAAVETLTNTNTWSRFASGTEGEVAIGGPTIDMFVASWNAKGYKKIYTATNKYGYVVGFNENPGAGQLNNLVDDGRGGLYFPYKNGTTQVIRVLDCFFLWLEQQNYL